MMNVNYVKAGVTIRPTTTELTQIDGTINSMRILCGLRTALTVEARKAELALRSVRRMLKDGPTHALAVQEEPAADKTA
jgi:hypothetical protein